MNNFLLSLKITKISFYLTKPFLFKSTIQLNRRGCPSAFSVPLLLMLTHFTTLLSSPKMLHKPNNLLTLLYTNPQGSQSSLSRWLLTQSEQSGADRQRSPLTAQCLLGDQDRETIRTGNTALWAGSLKTRPYVLKKLPGKTSLFCPLFCLLCQQL